MRKIKKPLLFTLLIVLGFILFGSSIQIGAQTYTTDDKAYNYTTMSEKTNVLAEGAEYILNEGYTTRGTTKYDQRVTMFTCDTAANPDIKIATWAIPNGQGTGFTRRGLLEIAKSYEENNPGWVVLGGINADQYFATLGTSVQTNGSYLYVPQPYYPMITNGENLFTVSAYGYATFHSVVGFKNDGSKTPFVNGTRGYKGFYIHIYDDNMNEIAAYPADGFDCELGTNGTTILCGYRESATKYKTIARNGTNDIYIVDNADLCYVSNNSDWKSICQYATDAFFGKGRITSIEKSVALSEGNRFAIETTNEELKSKLSVGTYVKVQLEFDDEMKGIQEAIGYHTVQRKNGKDMEVANSYNTRAYPRSWFGCDANGKIYLMTCFGDNSSPTKGLYAQEMNAYCKAYGITDAFQMDGGGSVTSVTRDMNGDLCYAEACIEESHRNQDVPTYAEYRYVFSGLFVVMKVPEANVTIEEKTDEKATLKVDTTLIKGKYDKAWINIQDKSTQVYQSFALDLTKDETVINVKELKANNDYTYEIVTEKEGVEQRSYKKTIFKTKKSKTRILLAKATKTTNGYDLTFNYSDEYDTLLRMKVIFGSQEFACVIDEENKIATCQVVGAYSLKDLVIEAESVLELSTRLHTFEKLDIESIDYPLEYYFEMTCFSLDNLLKKFSR